tara:strand:- start:4066 stop:4392 length:327 start_codon:yes stop_codon:yes gene_type:complete
LTGEKRYNDEIGATGADGRSQPPQDPHGRFGQKRDRTGMDGQILDQNELRSRILSMRDQHEALNNEVDALAENGVVDQLKLARLKKEKLRIKDSLAALNDQLTPDIIA